MRTKKKKTPSAREIIRVLKGYKYLYSSEKVLQEAVARVLEAKGISFEREKDLGRKAGIVDFMVGRIAIEIKIKGSPSQVARQLIRYCECPDVDEILLFTGRARLGALPKTLAGKPVRVVGIWESFL